jgi:hypothetical protein
MTARGWRALLAAWLGPLPDDAADVDVLVDEDDAAPGVDVEDQAWESGSLHR